jgi:adenine-specific DNA methylase
VSNYPKRLIEVDLPIRRISEYSRWEKKSIPGHIKQMHLWWARRPLAACRAVMCAALWPDPSDQHCPNQFRDVARQEMKTWSKRQLAKTTPESYPRFNALAQAPEKLDDLKELRETLLDFIGDFAMWENGAMPE